MVKDKNKMNTNISGQFYSKYLFKNKSIIYSEKATHLLLLNVGPSCGL